MIDIKLKLKYIRLNFVHGKEHFPDDPPVRRGLNGPAVSTNGRPAAIEDGAAHQDFFESVKSWSLICGAVSFSVREVVHVLHEDFCYFHVRSVHYRGRIFRDVSCGSHWA